MDWLHLVRWGRTAVLDINGKVGTEQGTQSTVDTRRIVKDFRGMVAFRVGVLGHDERALGAELDAKAASFTPFLDDVNDAMRYLDAISIQGLSPIGHGPSSILL
jgi:hypothetical protein